MPVTCRCHASTCRPSSGNYLPPPPSLSPLPWQHKSQSILHNAMRAWLNGGVAPAPLPPPFAFLTQNMQRRFWLPLVVFAFAPRCGTMGTKGEHKTFYAAFILLLHSRRKGEGARYCLKLYRECIRVNPPSLSAFALYVSCLRKHSNCLPYERRRTWKAKRKL